MKFMPHLTATLMLLAGLIATTPVLAEETPGYTEIEWVNLIPESDLNALMNPPDSLGQIPDGSSNDQLDGLLGNAMEPMDDSPYSRALVSTQVKTEYNNQKIRIPGFIVPIDLNSRQKVTEFFLVPYFGACIHVPPPPPNQIIYAQFDEGLEFHDLYAAYWLEGTLKTEIVSNEVATSAYTLIVDHITKY